ncbi:hypothetical protein CU254_41545 (plasmid) [Amycolatopsis sp. AA4]|uniref:MAB_1171c family putative transporter n=1 Tax=Actinomycetes TaxID=1760 RepID=UPI0001B55192|nr:MULTISPECIES: MAB_1171c family putative transporter [Actinomycetes]ATY17071.1 hypothetical protein CU254_41545 [Amycolatopsis sp. AA4]EFL12431.1 predicted protein [Streptomyces sp. AA4]
MVDSIGTVFHLFIVVVGVCVVVYKLVDLIRSPGRPAMWALWSAFLTLTLAIISGLRWVPVSPASAEVIWIVQHWLIFIAFAGLELFFFLSVIPQQRRAWRAFAPHGAVLLAAAAAMTVGFVAALATEQPDFLHLERYFGLWLTSMLLAYTAGFAAAMLAISRLASRWSRITDRPWMRRGLRLLAIGCWISLVYSAHKIAYSLLVVAGSPPPWSQLQVEVVLSALGVTFALVGLVLPALGPRLSAARSWFRHAGAYRRLEPLWREFADPDRGVTPEVVLANPAPWWATTFALHRRVIEIWDGRKRIRDYLDPAVERAMFETGVQRGLADTELAAFVEAECLREALRLKRAGRPPPDAGGIPPPRTGNNLAASVTFLEQVAAALAQPAPPAAQDPVTP